ncbi:MAG TPA: tetratricopeptide repeat protein, partial [Thermoanaerobaculia bacterium]|nr:tetratricopeptide repeat protein [Thermoanaerobaculia bacterium]
MSCIDEEILGAFVEGTLDAERRREVMEHLDTCEACTIAAGMAAEALREEAPAVVKPSSRAWWFAAAAVLATILLGIALLRPSSPMQKLVAAVPADRREVEARLSGGFAWAEFRGPARDESPTKSDPSRLKLQGAAGDVLARAAKDSSRETKHAAGIALMLVDDAPKSIETLRAIASDDAKIWSDLAAAHFATGRASQYPQALAAADRALSIDARLPEALFNRALVLERMGLLAEARKAWQRYLEIDPSSPWANEARAHLARLNAEHSSFEHDLPRLSALELVAKYPQQARTWGEGPFLAEWAERGDAKKLTLARDIGDALAKRSNETLLRDAVAAIDHAADSRALVEGHLAYRDGRIAYSRRDLAKAVTELAHAADALSRGGSPMALAARYFAANVVYDLNRPEDAFEQLTSLLATTPSSYRALRAQMFWQRALCSSTLSHWSEAVADAEQARATFESLGEDSNRAFVDVIIAEALEASEEIDRAWERRASAFEIFSRDG